MAGYAASGVRRLTSRHNRMADDFRMVTDDRLTELLVKPLEPLGELLLHLEVLSQEPLRLQVPHQRRLGDEAAIGRDLVMFDLLATPNDCAVHKFWCLDVLECSLVLAN